MTEDFGPAASSDVWQFTASPLWDSFALALVIAVVLLAAWWLWTPKMSTGKRTWTLRTLRLVTTGLLIAVWWRPAMVRTRELPSDAPVWIALDTSASMTLPAGDGSDRWSTQTESARRLAEQLRMAEVDEASIRWFRYDRSATQTASLEEALTFGPIGETTDPLSPLRQARGAISIEPPSAIVWMGDGTSTAYADNRSRVESSSRAPDRDETSAADIADLLAGSGIPILAVPIGPALSVGNRDVAIDSLPDSFELFAGNETTIRFGVRGSGVAGTPVRIGLSWSAADGSVDEFATRSVEFENGSGTRALEISTTVPPPGAYRLIVEADFVAGETITSNNRQQAFVDVRPGGGRVLYLEGSPRLEQTFLRRSLRRFADLDLVDRWARNDDRQPPLDEAALRIGSGFDLYILGDVPARSVNDSVWDTIADEIRQGAGLITLGGPTAYSAGGFARTAIADALPIDLDGTHMQLEGPLRLQVARSHPSVFFDPDSATLDDLPPLTGANRFSRIKPLPGIAVPLEDDQERPMMVVGNYERGRVASLAFDSTWRWWRSGNQDVHRRFWRQLTLWALSRDEDATDSIRLEMPVRRVEENSAIPFTASLDDGSDSPADWNVQLKPLDRAANPATDPVSTSKLVPATEPLPATKPLPAAELATDVSGDLNGRFASLPAGLYELSVSDRSRPTIAAATLAFEVIRREIELEFPDADLARMRRLAQLTASVGGDAFDTGSMDELARRIAERQSSLTTTTRRRFTFGETPATAWPLFILYTAAMTAEWILRRRWG